MDGYVYTTDDLEDFGNQSSCLDDNEEVVLFRSLEHELESLVQRYKVPADELHQLFEVREKREMKNTPCIHGLTVCVTMLDVFVYHSDTNNLTLRGLGKEDWVSTHYCDCWPVHAIIICLLL